MENEKAPRMEELESGQQEMQEKISRATKMVIDINPFIVPNLNNPCEQESFRKNSSGRSNHVDMQQMCSLLDKKLKEIEGVDDLGSVEN